MRPLARHLAALAAGAAVGFAAVAGLALFAPRDTPLAQRPRDPLVALKARFKRPTFVPHPPGEAPTPARIALGRRLFADKRLSADGTVACASCHDPRLSFTYCRPSLGRQHRRGR